MNHIVEGPPPTTKNFRYKGVMREAARIDTGLRAPDFPYEGVRIEHDDGSLFDLRHAFVKEIGNWTVLFTEHNGYFALATDDLKNVKVYRRMRRTPPYRWR